MSQVSVVLASFLGELSVTKKAVTALGGAFLAGIAFYASLVSFVGLPDDMRNVEQKADSVYAIVRQNTRAIIDLNRRMAADSVRFEKTVCLLTLDNREQMDGREMIRRCDL